MRHEPLHTRVIETLIELLAHPAGGVAKDAAWELHRLGAELAPYEKQLLAAQPRGAGTAREWIQDVIEAIEDAR